MIMTGLKAVTNLLLYTTILTLHSAIQSHN